jgi:hypothetical protein
MSEVFLHRNLNPDLDQLLLEFRGINRQVLRAGACLLGGELRKNRAWV